MTTVERYRITIYVGYEVVLHKAPGAHNPSQRSKLLCCIIHPVQGEGSSTASTQLPGPGEGGLSPSTCPQKPALKPKPLCVPEKGLEVSETPSTATPTTTSFPSRDTLTQSGDGQESPGTSTGSGPRGYGGDSRPESPHKDFHCAMLKALRTTNTELAALTLLEAPGTD